MKKLLYWIAGLAVVAVTFWIGYVYEPPEEKEEQKPIPVEIKTVDTNSIEDVLELTGWVQANKIVQLRSKVQGRIESLQAVTDKGPVPVEEGLAVHKGQQLAVIDHAVYEAKLAAAKAAVAARKVELADAEREKNRITALYKDGSATEQNKDKAVTAYELARAQLDSARANLKLAGINLDESTITSPMDGTVTAKHVDAGNLINVGDRICTIAEINTVKVIVTTPEKYLGMIKPGNPAQIRVDAYGDRIFEADVYSVYPALDSDTHTVQVEIRIDNRQLILRPGMFARVRLVLVRKEDAVVVLRDVVLGGKLYEPYVYVIENGVAKKKIVEVGIKAGKWCEIVNGLQPGEKLVVNGMHQLEDGKNVEVVELEAIE